MKKLKQKFYEKYAVTQITTVRDYIHKIDWTNRIIGIKGSRGVGKTTLILQYIKLNFKPDNSVLYASLDDFYFTENRLYELAEEFYKKGGKLLAIDEVHRYSNWALDIKNIYDDMPELKMIFTGSSLLHLQKAKADLSRRAVMYEMQGLSFREFIYFEQNIKLPIITFEDIISNHVEIAIELKTKFKPLSLIDNYFDYGYYPFFLENINSFHQKLSEIILTILEVDIPQFENIQTSSIVYLKKLLKIISNSVPFKPNMNSLSQRTGISLNTMKAYLKYLNDARLISTLYAPNKGINSLNKPEKIYLENSNLVYNLSENTPEKGNLRDTFFYNQVYNNLLINSSKFADFIIKEKFTFEIGGKNKSQKQIKNVENSFVVKDDIEIGTDNIIPLWLFGFLY